MEEDDEEAERRASGDNVKGWVKGVAKALRCNELYGPRQGLGMLVSHGSHATHIPIASTAH